jgi:zinc protease
MKIFKFLFIVGFLGLISNFSLAQDLSQPIPFDPQVKTGVLPNGIKYYIRKNAKPEKRVELRLAIKAGSILEDKDQLGLAHFVEHMCFNGTKNFPKNDLVKYLQSLGIKFGADLNAYTSFDETVYILPIPSDKKEILDGGFQVLEDWAHNVTFDNTEIDKERGVIIEEWRSRTGAEDRIRVKTFPKMFKGSLYPERLPIGDTGIIKNFKYDAIKRFYRDWYRPDLMGVMVVGDIDVDEMEKKIKFHFGRIAPAKNPRPRPEFDIPDHKTTEIAIAADKEQAFGNVLLMYKKDGKRMKTLGDYRQKLVYDLYNAMMIDRLEELTKSENPPFVNGFAFYSQVSVGFKNAYQNYASISENQALSALKALLLENKRALQFGFTASELDRAKKNLINRYESQYNEREKTPSARLVSEYVQNFLEEEPVPGIAFEYEFVKKILPTIQLAEINPLTKIFVTDENRVITITLPEKTGVKIPTEKEVLDVIAEVEKTDVKPYEDKVITEPLMAKIPTAGKIVSEKKLPEIDATELTLSNGAKVVYKKTNFKDDEILLSAYAKGGHSLASDADYHSAAGADKVITEGGLANFSSTDLKKVLTGKTADVSPYIGEYSQGLNGDAAPKDLETMFQLAHLYFTAPRKDEKAFKSFITKNKGMMKNLIANPNFYFIDQVSKIMSQNHPRAQGLPKPEDFDKINLDKAIEFYKARFANAANFTFVLVGAFDENELRKHIETYIASLPSQPGAKPEVAKDLGIRPPKGVVEKSFEKGKDNRSQVMITITDELKNEKDAFNIRMAAEVLSIKLIENLREEKGGVYGTSARPSITKEPKPRYSITVQFTCAPENVDKLTKAVYEEIQKLQKDGPKKEDLDKVKETQRRDIEKNVKENRFWQNGLRRIYYEDAKPELMLEAKMRERVDKLTEKDIQSAAKKYMNYKKNRIIVASKPENQPESNEPKANEGQKAGGKDGNVSVESVLNKYIDAIGGKDKVAKVTSLKQVVTMDMGGMPMNITTMRKQGKMIMLQDMMGKVTKIVVNGDKSFVSSPKGIEDLPKEQASQMGNIEFFFVEEGYQKAAMKAQLEKTEKVDGRDAHKISFKKGDKVALEKWYDVNSGLEVKSIIGGVRELKVKEYQEVQGIKFPKKMIMEAQGMEIQMETTTEVNVDIPESEFEKK